VGAVLEEAPRLAADALKAMAVAVRERLEEIPGLEMVGLVHDEVLLLAPEEHTERAEGWLTGIMEGVGDSVVNGGGPPEERVPIVADTHVCTSWAGKK
jgi:DNA polymerase I-like protein with 3'-5' exonuclease and polymerase domains